MTATIGTTKDFSTAFSYDGLDRLTKITQQSQSGGNAVANKRIDFAHDDGQFEAIQRYADLGGSQLVATSTYGYDTTGRLTGLTHTKGATTLAGYAWTWDSANRIMSMTNSLWSAEDVTYDYDRLGQLISADRDGSSFDEEYEYDENGNRTNNGFEAEANNRLETDGTYVYGYDAEGNVLLRTKISDGSYTVYQWDHRNRLVSVTDFDDEEEQVQQVSYAYDAGNRLVSRTLVVGEEDPVSGYFIYDGNQMTLALDDEGNVEHRLLWGPAVDQILADENGDGDVYWMLTDHQNTVRDIVEYNAGEDETNVVNHIAYNSFGNKLSETNDTVETLDLNYTGRYFDEATGLQWNLNRWYNPSVGRWMSEDPIGFGGGQANLSVYVGNTPANATDPCGLFKSGIHRQLVMQAATAAHFSQFYAPQLANEDVNVDFNTTVLEAAWHAQEPSFVQYPLRRLMWGIRLTTMNSNVGIFDTPIDVMIRDIGRALHVLQDFYSHTDWIDGRNLQCLYNYYGDTKLARDGKSHQPNSHTLNLTLVANGNNQQVRDLNYFSGGYLPWGKWSVHNKYAADETNFGRDDQSVPGHIPGSFTAAYNLALQQSIEFLRWAEANMHDDMRRILFGSIPYPDDPSGPTV